MLATKNVPFRVIKELSFLTIPTISHETEPIEKQIYPDNTIPNAIKNAPIIEAIVPSHAILFIVSLYGKGLEADLILP